MADEDPWVDIVNDPITATGATGAGGAPAEASAARPAPSAVAPAAAGMHKGMLIPGPPPGPPPGGPPQPPTPAACDRAAGSSGGDLSDGEKLAALETCMSKVTLGGAAASARISREALESASAVARLSAGEMAAPPAPVLPSAVEVGPSPSSAAASEIASPPPLCQPTRAPPSANGAASAAKSSASPPADVPAGKYRQIVCRHWFRGFCMKGEQCTFLHHYSPDRMPQCQQWLRYGSCREPQCQFKHSGKRVGSEGGLERGERSERGGSRRRGGGGRGLGNGEHGGGLSGQGAMMGGQVPPIGLAGGYTPLPLHRGGSGRLGADDAAAVEGGGWRHERRAPSGNGSKPSRGYVCHRCGVPGHWKKDCPYHPPPPRHSGSPGAGYAAASQTAMQQMMYAGYLDPAMAAAMQADPSPYPATFTSTMPYAPYGTAGGPGTPGAVAPSEGVGSGGGKRRARQGSNGGALGQGMEAYAQALQTAYAQQATLGYAEYAAAAAAAAAGSAGATDAAQAVAAQQQQQQQAALYQYYYGSLAAGVAPQAAMSGAVAAPAAGAPGAAVPTVAAAHAQAVASAAMGMSPTQQQAYYMQAFAAQQQAQAAQQQQYQHQSAAAVQQTQQAAAQQAAALQGAAPSPYVPVEQSAASPAQSSAHQAETELSSTGGATADVTDAATSPTAAADVKAS